MRRRDIRPSATSRRFFWFVLAVLLLFAVYYVHLELNPYERRQPDRDTNHAVVERLPVAASSFYSKLHFDKVTKCPVADADCVGTFFFEAPSAEPKARPNQTLENQCAERLFERQQIWRAQGGGREQREIWESELKQLEHGFYIEMGGYDGVTESTSLVLSRCAGWHGLLVEAQHGQAVRMAMTRPEAISLHAAPSCIEHSSVRLFGSGFTSASQFDASEEYYLKMMGVDRVTFFSLDVENAEQDVMEAFDWNAVHVEMLMVEVSNRMNNEPKKKWLKEEWAPANHFSFKREIGASWVFVHESSYL